MDYDPYGNYSEPFADTSSKILSGQYVSPEEFKAWYESTSGYNRPYQGEDMQGVLAGVTEQARQDQVSSDELTNLIESGLLVGGMAGLGGLAAGMWGPGAIGAEGAGFIPSITAESAAAEASYPALEESLAAAVGGTTGPLMPPAIAPQTSAGYSATPFESTSGGVATQYNLVDPAAVSAAGLSGAGFAPTSLLEPSGGLPISPTTALKGAQLANSLMNSGNKFPNLFGGQGGSLFGQSGTPGGSSYMRKARQPMQQPAFLGEPGQQPLGSVEDAMFNEQLAGRREDVSNRARQMAAQLRGRTTTFGFRER